MARKEPQRPRAAILMESLRDIGYSLDTAVADIIDNSISASATEVQIIGRFLPPDNNPVIGIVDNGIGMTEEEIILAMRHGSQNPMLPREKTDLGRFGLGLKTASFSQCRQLTVISLKNGNLSGAQWDLDDVQKEDDWMLTVLDSKDIKEYPFLETLKEHGTLVIWQKMDRIFDGDSSGISQQIFNEKITTLGHHLSLVFHRFLSGEFHFAKHFQIVLNGQVLKPFDPFLTGSSTRFSSDMLEEEILYLDSGQGKEKISIQPYILPHYSRLSPKEADFYENRSDYLSNQGIYIYRNGRLMVWGKWFRLHSQSESTKYARIQVDYPSTLDHFWTIDIKKSSASLPPVVRDKIRQLLPNIEGRSTEIHRKRGKKLLDADMTPLWNRYIQRDGPIKYLINQEHPLVEEIRERVPDDTKPLFNLLLETISRAIPAESIYDDMATHPREMEQKQLSDNEFEKQLLILRKTITEKQTFMNVVKAMFTSDDDRMKIIEKFAEENFK